MTMIWNHKASSSSSATTSSRLTRLGGGGSGNGGSSGSGGNGGGSSGGNGGGGGAGSNFVTVVVTVLMTVLLLMEHSSFASALIQQQQRQHHHHHNSLSIHSYLKSKQQQQEQSHSSYPSVNKKKQSSTLLFESSGNTEQSSTSTSTATIASSSSSSTNQLPQIPFVTKTILSDRSNDLMIGEDAGVFDIQTEEWGTLGSIGWFTFSAAVATILTAVAILWIYPPTGYSDDFMQYLETDIAHGNSHIVTLMMGIIFPIVHSGLASLRPYGEQIVGARMWRVIFAFPSLCLAYSWIVYFIAHAHDGIPLYPSTWSQNDIVHSIAWCMNFISFFFLYPSVFNLKEVAAVEIPKIHLWETGMIRITRHPQFVGQTLWSIAHFAMVGTSFTALTMLLLVGHHYFACWNGDRRLLDQHGDKFLQIKERTSVMPFQAIWEGRQILPKDYYKELLRGPYLVIAVGTLGAYFAHPYMQAGAALVKNTGLVPGGIFSSLDVF